MTNSERARRFHDCLRSNCSEHETFEDCEKELILAFDEAVTEANFRKDQEIVFIKQEAGEMGVRLGFAAAKAKAKGIAVRHFQETEYHDDTTCDCGGVIAERIEAMEP